MHLWWTPGSVLFTYMKLPIEVLVRVTDLSPTYHWNVTEDYPLWWKKGAPILSHSQATSYYFLLSLAPEPSSQALPLWDNSSWLWGEGGPASNLSLKTGVYTIWCSWCSDKTRWMANNISNDRCHLLMCSRSMASKIKTFCICHRSLPGPLEAGGASYRLVWRWGPWRRGDCQP